MAAQAEKAPPMKIAVLFENIQLADVACIDLLGNCSTWFIEASKEFGMGPLLPYARDMEFSYISSTREPALMTPSFRCVPTHTYEDAPRDVDILLVGGPPLSHRPPGSLKYIQEVCADTKKKVIMSTCVGGMWLASAGCLDGVKATTNRGALGAARHFHPDVEWIDQRWVVFERGHLKFWTAGGAGAGIDMMATYVKEILPEPIVKNAMDSLDFDPTVKGQYYTGEVTDWFEQAMKEKGAGKQ